MPTEILSKMAQLYMIIYHRSDNIHGRTLVIYESSCFPHEFL